MRNTLKNLAVLQSEKFGYQHIRDVFDQTASEARIYGKFLSAVFSETAFKTEADRLDRKMKDNEIAREVAAREWELAESYLRIYQVQVSKFYAFLTGQPNNFFPENTVGGLEQAQKKSAERLAEFTRLENTARNLIRQEQDSPDLGHFQSDGSEMLEEANRQRQEWHEKLKTLKQGESEWQTVKNFVMAQDWTADEYVAKIKEYLDK